VACDPDQEKLFDMADEHESSVIETIAKALWLFSMRKINSMSGAEWNLEAKIAADAPRADRLAEKFKTYSKPCLIFTYKPHRESK
jgi:hypothetical protein